MGGKIFPGLAPKKVVSRVRLTWKMLENPKTGCLVKVIIVVGILYILSPFDLWMFNILDDAFVIWFIAWLLPEFIPAEVINPLKEEAGMAVDD